jgi:hypothetical protein
VCIVAMEAEATRVDVAAHRIEAEAIQRRLVAVRLRKEDEAMHEMASRDARTYGVKHKTRHQPLVLRCRAAIRWCAGGVEGSRTRT